MKMTPKEKAKELVDKFARIDGYQDSIDLSKCDYEKQCALITVDEILEVIKFYEKKNGRLLIDNIRIMYWEEVKQEIELL